MKDAVLNGFGVASGTAGMMVPTFFTILMFSTIGAHYLIKRVYEGKDVVEVRKAEERVHVQKLDDSPRKILTRDVEQEGLQF